MKYDAYTELRVTDDFSIIDFISDGTKGAIPKRISFTSTEMENVYNLAFGDIMENGEIDDYTISDNGDRNKILATVANVVDNYTNKYPERWVFFRGSTKERTRLYRIAVSNNFDELCKKFDIYGYVGEELVVFCKGMEINAFLVKRKFV